MDSDDFPLSQLWMVNEYAGRFGSGNPAPITSKTLPESMSSQLVERVLAAGRVRRSTFG